VSDKKVDATIPSISKFKDGLLVFFLPINSFIKFNQLAVISSFPK